MRKASSKSAEHASNGCGPGDQDWARMGKMQDVPISFYRIEIIVQVLSWEPECLHFPDEVVDAE